MKQMRVVLAEDDPIARINVKEILEEEGITTVGECGDGETAVQLIRELKPDLVIMDIKMPKMDGIEAARELNKDNIAPVLMLTAYSQSELVDEARQAGVLAYLVKPINKQSLIPACRIAVSRYKEFEALRAEKDTLLDAMEARKIIERAKNLLERKYALDEESAFARIKQISLNQKKTMQEVAEAIILTLS